MSIATHDTNHGEDRSHRRPVKWQVMGDDHGNFFFLNAETGETTWELPDEPDEDEDDGDNIDYEDDFDAIEAALAEEMNAINNTLASKNVIKPVSAFDIAVATADCMVQLLDAIEKQTEEVSIRKKKTKKYISAAAEARAKKNAIQADKKATRMREQTFAHYMKLLLPSMEKTSTSDSVGSLFTQDDCDRWTQEKERAQRVKRHRLRKDRREHHHQVYALAQHQRMLKQFRTDLTRHLMQQIAYSTEVQKQGVLLLATPQQRAELERKRRKELEPELLERYLMDRETKRKEKQMHLQAIFHAADEGRQQQVHLLQVLFAIFTHDDIQKTAIKVAGLAALLESTDLQRFVMGFVSRSRLEQYVVNWSDFEAFVDIVEETVEHFVNVKAAVEEAENEIQATLEAAALTPGTSATRARLGLVSRKKVEQELALLKATEDQLMAQRARERQAALGPAEASYIAPTEEWERNHQHRWIRFEASTALFCCQCRRRKWELGRREQEELESAHRSAWPTTLAARQKAEELRLLEKYGVIDPPSRPNTAAPRELQDNLSEKVAISQPAQPVSSVLVDYSSGWMQPVEEDVVDVVRYLVALVERIMDDTKLPKKPEARVHKPIRSPSKPKAARSPTKAKKAKTQDEPTAKSPMEQELDQIMNTIERQETERKHMYAEETYLQVLLERQRRLQERPLLRAQEVAHQAYVRLLEHCMSPLPFLFRLEFHRSLAFHPPMRLVLQVVDHALPSNVAHDFILTTVPCRNEQEGAFVYRQLSAMEKNLKSPFMVQVASVSKHMYQLSSDLGLLVECWPVVFVVQEYFAHGLWIDRFRQSIPNEYEAAERMILSAIRDIAAGVTSLHSIGVLHLNLQLSNVFVTASGVLRVTGLLAFKAGYCADDLASGRIEDCIEYAIAPPEMTRHEPLTAKADVWMLGCMVFQALMVWQAHQVGHEDVGRTKAMHTKTIESVLDAIPPTATGAMRSLLRMLLQRNPSQRPPMSQVVDFISFTAGQNLSLILILLNLSRLSDLHVPTRIDLSKFRVKVLVLGEHLKMKKIHVDVDLEPWTTKYVRTTEEKKQMNCGNGSQSSPPNWSSGNESIHRIVVTKKHFCNYTTNSIRKTRH